MDLRYKKTNTKTGKNLIYAILIYVFAVFGYYILTSESVGKYFSRESWQKAKATAEARKKQVMKEMLESEGRFEQGDIILFHDIGKIDRNYAMFRRKPGDAEIMKQFVENYVPGMVGHDRNIMHRLALENRPFPIIRLGTSYPELINDADFNGVTPICVALLRGSKEAANAFYKLEKVDCGVTDKNGNTLLHYAARAGHLDIAARALEAGQSPNAKSKSGRTPLIISVQNEHFDVFALLLEHGGDPKIAVGDKDCFHYASNNNKFRAHLQKYISKKNRIPRLPAEDPRTETPAEDPNQ
ncbi:MAG: ankyrin repeat domain-containing protein [Candidatus Riflebacteria bacterium]|nr:ankyrin repeat domain-containing protein [Candidatus Riflebacteria bacterium]